MYNEGPQSCFLFPVFFFLLFSILYILPGRPPRPPFMCACRHSRTYMKSARQRAFQDSSKDSTRDSSIPRAELYARDGVRPAEFLFSFSVLLCSPRFPSSPLYPSLSLSLSSSSAVHPVLGFPDGGTFLALLAGSRPAQLLTSGRPFRSVDSRLTVGRR